MADLPHHPTVIEKVVGQLHLGSSIFSSFHSQNCSFYQPAHYQLRLANGFYNYRYLQNFMFNACQGGHGISTAITIMTPMVVNTPLEQGNGGVFVDILVGGASFIFRETASAPINRVKLLIQNQGEMIKSGRLSKPYSGIVDCFIRTIKTEGFISLWRGNMANMISYFPAVAFNSAFGDYFYRLYGFKGKEVGSWKRFAGNVVSQSACTASLLLCLYPLDYAQTRLANDVTAGQKIGKRQFNGLIDVYMKTLQSDGIAGIYRGFGIACIGIIVYNCIAYGSYQCIKPFIPFRDLKDINFTAKVILAGSMITAGIAHYPFDTLSRRMMMTSGEAVKYKSSMEAFSQILKNEGGKSLFNGFGAKTLRLVVTYYLLYHYNNLQIQWNVFGRKYGSHAKEKKDDHKVAK